MQYFTFGPYEMLVRPICRTPDRKFPLGIEGFDVVVDSFAWLYCTYARSRYFVRTVSCSKLGGMEKNVNFMVSVRVQVAIILSTYLMH